MLGLFGHPVAPSETTEPGMKIVAVPEDVPKFTRSYSARLDGRAKVEVRARTFGGWRTFSGELVQPNGNSVWFDPARIADRILDPTLVPLVQKFCDEMFAADREYVKGRPASFVDEKGDVWVRQ